MIPPVLEERIVPIGNAAGEGSQTVRSQPGGVRLQPASRRGAEFLELACLPDFQDRFVDALGFLEECE